jgi:hypothetical protein
MSPIWIAAFFVIGTVFGLATYSTRHLYSEGPSRPDAGGGARDMAMWICIASALWPVLVLAGAYGAWRRQQRLRGARR